MIEFKGELCKECQKFVMRRTTRPEKISLTVAGLLFAIPIVIIAVNWEAIVLLMLAPVAYCMIYPWLPKPKKMKLDIIPQRVVIDTDDECVIIYCGQFERFHMFSTIEAVVDHGEWYAFEFASGDWEPAAVCQKDLVSAEELDAFKSLFDSHIQKPSE